MKKKRATVEVRSNRDLLIVLSLLVFVVSLLMAVEARAGDVADRKAERAHDLKRDGRSRSRTR